MIIMERQIVIFTLGNEEFGVRINEVKEIIRMEQITKLPNTDNYVSGVINLRGEIIVVIDLAMKLGIARHENDKNTRIIVIEVNDNTIGMIVDSATEVMRLNEGQIKPAPAIITEKINSQYIEGVGIINERLLILLDLAKVLKSNEINSLNNIKPSSVPKTTKEIKKEEIKEDKLIKKKSTSPEIKSAEEHPALKDVHEDFHFIDHEGKPIKNVHELLKYIASLDQETFKIYVNEEKNDFYNWIKHIIKDDKLADNIQHIKNKNDVTKEIMNRILEIKLN